VTAPAIPFIVAALLLLPACAGDTTPAPSIEATPDTATTPTEDTDTAGDGDGDGGGGDGPPGPAAGGTSASDPDSTILTLVDAGHAPHQALRYDFSAAKLEVPVPGTVTTTYGIAGTTAAGDALPAREATTVAAPTEMAVVDVDDDGTATVSFAFTGGEIIEPGGAEGQELAGLEAVMEALAGVQTTFEVDDRGFTTPIGLDGPGASGSRPDVTAITRRVPSFVQPLPAEPIGVGAVWTVQRITHLGGFPVEQSTTVELLDIDGDLIELLFTVTDAVPTGEEAAAPVLPGQVQLIELTLDGGGNSTTRLDRPLPVGASHGMTAQATLQLLGTDRGEPVQRTILSDASLETHG
jgi:hypothetical protein